MSPDQVEYIEQILSMIGRLIGQMVEEIYTSVIKKMREYTPEELERNREEIYQQVAEDLDMDPENLKLIVRGINRELTRRYFKKFMRPVSRRQG
jgi:predicted nucleic acid-binding OB-fold protein